MKPIARTDRALRRGSATLLPRIAAAAALLLLALPTLAPAQETPAARVHALFEHFNEGTQPGVAVAVVRDGEVVLSEGWGLASLEHRVPITSSTVFDVASVSKQFTGLAIAMLVERGQIHLDDDVRSYIPELPDFGRTITLRHLVHHTSGLRDWPGALSIAGWRYDDVISFDQILRFAYAQRDLNFEPGSEYTYSNTGYNLLAEVVARVSGQTFREWTDEHLFRPLGMTRTHFHDDHTEVVPDRAYGYARTRDGYRRMTNNLTALGSSSLFSTVDDLAKWVLNFETARVGGASALAMTRTRGVLSDGSEIAYAFGISHGDHRGVPIVTHGGSWAQFSTYVVHYPEQRFGVVVLSNSSSNAASRAAFEVALIYLQDELPPRAAEEDGSPVEAVEVASSILEEYEGVYRLGPAWYVRVRRDGGALLARATREDEAPMTPLSDAEFRVDAYGGASITFQRDDSGRVSHFTYRGMTAPRLDDGDGGTPPNPDELAGVYASEELDTSYRVEVENGIPVLRHHRHGTIRLVHAWGDDYAGSLVSLRSVEFQRDAAGRVTGLLMNAGERNRDIRFVKVR